jgi:hypothetical protein
VEDHESLCAFLANIHQTQIVFELIVIDGARSCLLPGYCCSYAVTPDLTTYFTRTQALERNLENLAFALAMLKDAADFFTSQLYEFAVFQRYLIPFAALAVFSQGPTQVPPIARWQSRTPLPRRTRRCGPC